MLWWIGHVRYINILTWLRGFQVKPLYLVLFSLYLKVSFGNWGTKETWKICNFDPKASEPCSNIDISNVAYWHLSKQGIRWPVSRDHIEGSNLELIEVTWFFKLTAHQTIDFLLDHGLKSGYYYILGESGRTRKSKILAKFELWRVADFSSNVYILHNRILESP